MSESPSVSLLIPCYNNARFLPQLFASIRAQALPFAEILLLDDGSTDDSAQVAAKFGARVIRGTTNQGPAGARNALAQAAAHEWIHFHDADDVLDTEFTAVLFPEISDSVDVVFCDADWMKPTGDVLIPWRYSNDKMQHDPLNYFIAHPLGINNCIYRRSTFEKSGGFAPELVPWEDADFHVRLAELGARFKHLPQVLTRSLRHDGGISVDPHRNWQARLRGLEGYADRLPSRTHPQLALAAEQAARELAFLGDRQATTAIRLARRCGGRPPSGGGWILKVARRILPAETLLRWQAKRRHRAILADSEKQS